MPFLQEGQYKMGALYKVQSHAHGDPRRQTKNKKLPLKHKTRARYRQNYDGHKLVKTPKWAETKRPYVDNHLQ